MIGLELWFCISMAETVACYGRWLHCRAVSYIVGH